MSGTTEFTDELKDLEDRMVMLKMTVPYQISTTLEDDNCCKLHELQNETKTQITFSRSGITYPGTFERPFIVTGSMNGVKKLNGYIMDKISRHECALPIRGRQIRILVPNAIASIIIGVRGTMINSIINASRARIVLSKLIPNRYNSERALMIMGGLQNRETAFSIILEMVGGDQRQTQLLGLNYEQLRGPFPEFVTSHVNNDETNTELKRLRNHVDQGFEVEQDRQYWSRNSPEEFVFQQDQHVEELDDGHRVHRRKIAKTWRTMKYNSEFHRNTNICQQPYGGSSQTGSGYSRSTWSPGPPILIPYNTGDNNSGNHNASYAHTEVQMDDFLFHCSDTVIEISDDEAKGKLKQMIPIRKKVSSLEENYRKLFTAVQQLKNKMIDGATRPVCRCRQYCRDRKCGCRKNGENCNEHCGCSVRLCSNREPEDGQVL